MQIDDQIKRRAEKAKKNNKTNVNIFGDNQEKNENNNENALQNDEEDTDYVVQGKVIDTNVNNNNNNNTNLNNETWKDDANLPQYNPDEQPEKKVEKKKIGWGDNIKSSNITSHKVNAEQMYFPDLNDKNAEKNAPKKEKNSSLKNPELFGTGQSSTGGGNWSNPKSDKFRENDNAIRFTNAKGNTEKLNKFMVKEGPTYDDTLGDNVEAKEDLDPQSKAPLKFSGKIKIGVEMTEADKQRERYLKEVQERAEITEQEKAQEREERKNNTFDKPRFTNSKTGGFRNNGLMMQDSNGHTEHEEKRVFTNSKKANAVIEPVLDPNVPTATKTKGAEIKVTMKTWD